MANFEDYEQVAKDNNIGGGGNYWRPQPGENRIRVVSGFEAHGKHFIKADNKSYECVGKAKGCIYCLNGDKPKVEFLMWIIDRADKGVKLGQVGFSIIKSIGQLSKSPDWGAPNVDETGYDLVVIREGEGLKTKYFVNPTPAKTPLTADEKLLVEANTSDLNELIQSYKDAVTGETTPAVEPSFAEAPATTDQVPGDPGAVFEA